MVQFEPYITSALHIFGRQMDSLIDTGRAAAYVSLSETDQHVRRYAGKGQAALDVAVWSAFLAFDIIGDLVSLHIGSREAGSYCLPGLWTAIWIYRGRRRYQRWYQEASRSGGVVCHCWPDAMDQE
jgi:hypothetical protein